MSHMHDLNADSVMAMGAWMKPLTSASFLVHALLLSHVLLEKNFMRSLAGSFSSTAFIIPRTE